MRSKSNSQLSSIQKKEEKAIHADAKSSSQVAAESTNPDNRKFKAQSNDNMLNSKTSSNVQSKPTPEQMLRNKWERIELFCGGNQEVKMLTYYINSKLEGWHQSQKLKQK